MTSACRTHNELPDRVQPLRAIPSSAPASTTAARYSFRAHRIVRPVTNADRILPLVRAYMPDETATCDRAELGIAIASDGFLGCVANLTEELYGVRWAGASVPTVVCGCLEDFAYMWTRDGKIGVRLPQVLVDKRRSKKARAVIDEVVAFANRHVELLRWVEGERRAGRATAARTTIKAAADRINREQQADESDNADQPRRSVRAGIWIGRRARARTEPVVSIVVPTPPKLEAVPDLAPSTMALGRPELVQQMKHLCSEVFKRHGSRPIILEDLGAIGVMGFFGPWVVHAHLDDNTIPTVRAILDTERIDAQTQIGSWCEKAMAAIDALRAAVKPFEKAFEAPHEHDAFMLRVMDPWHNQRVDAQRAVRKAGDEQRADDKKLKRSRWLAMTFRGQHVVKGRAFFPEGAETPERDTDSNTTWTNEGGGVWSFCRRWFGPSCNDPQDHAPAFKTEHAWRIDYHSYRPTAKLMTGHMTVTAAEIVAHDGLPVALLAVEDAGDDLDPEREAHAFEATFGNDFVLGPWAKNALGRWQAPVMPAPRRA